jgi:signal peptidase I
MGDNRNNSSDSRKHGDPTPADGAIPIDNVVGKARVIVIPVGRWGTISDYNPQTGGK